MPCRQRAARQQPRLEPRARAQGLTLVLLSAQLKRILWDRGCMQGLFWGCLGGAEGLSGGVQGVFCVRSGSG